MTLLNALQNTAALNREVRDIRAAKARAVRSQATQEGRLVRRDRATGKYLVEAADGGTYLAQGLTGRGLGTGGRVVLRVGSNGRAFADWL